CTSFSYVLPKVKQTTTNRIDSTYTADSVTISERAGKRLFRDVMENSLQKGLREVIVDEN
ncbi:MAG: hypothetical protein MZU95_14035, partial [Desulfomicrobium escambiense]|nr:hypothetical protein [Desulfomicrobium escambiense]